jgi:hypothetical protein
MAIKALSGDNWIVFSLQHLVLKEAKVSAATMSTKQRIRMKTSFRFNDSS